jgi:hypothetical protein
MALLAVPADQPAERHRARPRVNDLIEAIHYQSTSPAAGSKTINYALTDAELETVNQSLALTITGSQAPTISGLNTTLSINTVQAGAGAQLDNAVLVDNPDGTQFGGGSLVVSVAGATADDNLVIVQTSRVTIVGNQMFHNGVPVCGDRVGWFCWQCLQINFLSGSSETRVNDLIEAIHYQSTSPAAGSKTINYALTDAELETVNQSLALTITSSSNIITGTNDDDFLVGTSGDDLIQPLDATPEVGDTIVASGGNDEIDFAGSVDGFYNVNYHTLGVGIDATIGATTASLIKSGIGTDTWSNVDQINGNAGGVTLRTSSQNDTFNVDTTGLEWLALRVGGGTDTITRTGTGDAAG